MKTQLLLPYNGMMFNHVLPNVILHTVLPDFVAMTISGE